MFNQTYPHSLPGPHKVTAGTAVRDRGILGVSLEVAERLE